MVNVYCYNAWPLSIVKIHGSSSKLIPDFWSIFADFQNQVCFGSNINVSAKYESIKIQASLFGIENDPSF